MVTKDVRAGFHTVKENFLSFTLAIMATAFVVGIFFLIAIIGLVVLVWFTNPGIDIMAIALEAFLSWTIPLSTGEIAAYLTLIFLGVVTPLFVIATWIFGGVYGMSKDIVSGDSPPPRVAFTWLRQNSKKLFLAGIVNSLIVVLPVSVVGVILSSIYNFEIPTTIAWAFGGIGVLWVFLVTCFTHLYIPAIVDGESIIGGLKKAFSLSSHNFSRIFTSWGAIAFLAFMWYAPIILLRFLTPGITPATNPEITIFVVLAAVGAFLDSLLFFPLMIATMTIIYHDTKQDE